MKLEASAMVSLYYSSIGNNLTSKIKKCCEEKNQNDS